MDTREELDPEGRAADIALAKEKSGVRRIYAMAWSFMCSLPRAMYLLMVLGVACFVGMFFDQTLTYEEHAAQWAQQAWKLKLFTFLEMNDVFGSWWFVIIIGYLLISITACSIERFPKIWLDALYPRKHLSDQQLKGIKQIYRATVRAADLPKVRKVVGAVFGRRMFVDERDGTSWFFLERHRFARFGVYIIHAGLVTIFTGVDPKVCAHLPCSTDIYLVPSNCALSDSAILVAWLGVERWLSSVRCQPPCRRSRRRSAGARRGTT